MKMSKLLALALVLLISVGTLAGSTIAWFTDEVTSKGNIIKSGTLELEVAVQSTKDAGFVALSDDKPDTVFDYELWEPGYVATRGVQIKNAGSLALKYQLFINPNNAAEVSELANVIDVYSSAAWPTGRTELGERLGTLAEIINGTATIEGKIAAGAADHVRFLSLKMQESAGNEYQNKGIGTFDLQVLATQDTVELDSFDNQYDAEATWSEDLWDGNTPTEQPDSINIDKANYTIYIGDAEGLAYLNTLVNDPGFAADNGSKWKYTIELNANIDLRNNEWTPINLSNFVAFEGNGHTIRNLKVSGDADYAGLFGSVKCNDIGVTYVRDLTIDGAVVSGGHGVGAVAGSSPQGVFENVTVNNATLTGTKYVGGIFGSGNGTVTNCTVKNSSISIPAGGEKEAGGLIGYVSNDGKESNENKIISGNYVENVTISAPTIAAGLVAQPNSSNTGGAIIVIEGNTLKNVRVMTLDETANLYVSNNVGNKSVVKNNTEDGSETCTGIYGLKLAPNGNKSGTITVSDKEGLLNLTELAEKWVTLFSNGQGTEYSNYATANGGKGTDYYYHWTWDIVLGADIDMNNILMNSVDISYWDSFDGNNHTISNVVLKDGQDGLFNNGAKAISNLTVKNITVNAPDAQTVGAVAGNGSMTNVHVENATVTGGKYVGGICGKGSSFTNCSIKDSTVTGTDKTVGGLVGYSIGDPNAATVSGNTVEDVTVTGAYNVGGLLGQAQNETVKDNTVKNVTVISTTELPTGASTNEVRTAQVAARSVFDNTTIGTNTVEDVTLTNK